MNPELIIQNLEADINLSQNRLFISVLEIDHDRYGCQELDKTQAIQLRDFLNEFIEANNE